MAVAFENEGHHERAKTTVAEAIAEMSKYEGDFNRLIPSTKMMRAEAGAAASTLATTSGNRFRALAALAEALIVIGDVSKAKKMAEDATAKLAPVRREDLRFSGGVVWVKRDFATTWDEWTSTDEYAEDITSAADVLASAGLVRQAREAAQLGGYLAEQMMEMRDQYHASITFAESAKVFARTGDAESGRVAALRSLDAAGTLRVGFTFHRHTLARSVPLSPWGAPSWRACTRGRQFLESTFFKVPAYRLQN